MSEAVWIVLVDFNGLADTRKCLESLRNVTGQFRTVVVDNASKVEVAPLLQPEFPGVDFVRSAVNGGWAGGNNIGLKHALEHGGQLIILLNNDTVVASDFVERLKAAATAHPTFGIIGPVIRFMDPPSDVQTDGVKFNRPNKPGFFQREPVPLATTNPPTVAQVDIVNGCCLMVRREVVETIGFVDEEYFLIHEESDFCLRAQRAGFQNGVLAEALVWHKGSSTFQREGKRYQRYYDARNLVRLIRKHHQRRGSRRLIRSLLHHLRYAYHRYALEREHGYPDSASAVLEGLYDAIRGHYGAFQPRSRPGLRVMQFLFSLAWKWKGQVRDPM